MNLKDNLKKREFLIISGAFTCFLIFSLIISQTGISADYAATFQGRLIRFMMFGTSDMSMEASLIVSVLSFIPVMLSLIFLVAGFAFLSSYGFLKNNRIVGLIASLVSVIFILAIFNFSVVSFFFSIGLIFSCVLIIPLANTYGKELKRWIFFRTGSHSINTALLILNILIGLGVFIAVTVNADHYRDVMEEDFSATMEVMLIGEMSGIGIMTEAQEEMLRDQVRQQADEFFSNSSIMQSLVKFLPLIVAFSTWAFLELLRMLILPNIGGIINDALIRLSRKK